MIFNKVVQSLKSSVQKAELQQQTTQKRLPTDDEYGKLRSDLIDQKLKNHPNSEPNWNDLKKQQQ